MSVKDFSHAWDEAAQRALETDQESELTLQQLSSAAGFRVRTGIAAGKDWGFTDDCSHTCS